jgi:hypothetical protein
VAALQISLLLTVNKSPDVSGFFRMGSCSTTEFRVRRHCVNNADQRFLGLLAWTGEREQQRACQRKPSDRNIVRVISFMAKQTDARAERGDGQHGTR